jgi:hypothetical protein
MYSCVLLSHRTARARVFRPGDVSLDVGDRFEKRLVDSKVTSHGAARQAAGLAASSGAVGRKP